MLSLVDLPVRNEPRPQAHPAEELLHPDAKRQRLVVIEQICLTLFDQWCERRNALALAYLMYGWPLTNDDPSLIGRLLQSLRELAEHHRETLLHEETELLGLLLDNE
ncbi:hypothetical protein [Paraburkholderia sp. GAS32]|uniref:hypothetical protein n=1 Tax=Paraburkholderia sp. GAS32 TaxID=3035129 RepID=UPI003D21DF26